MARSPRSPRVQRGGFVLLEPPAWRVARVLIFQYNPEAIHRRAIVSPSPVSRGLLGSLFDWWPGGPPSGTGEPRERIEFELAFDAADDLEVPGAHPETVRLGVLPRLDALRAIAFPAPSTGTVPVLVLVLGAHRFLPVRASALDVGEEEFSPTLCPLRARVRIELEVLQPQELPAGGLPDHASQTALREVLASTEGM